MWEVVRDGRSREPRWRGTWGVIGVTGTEEEVVEGTGRHGVAVRNLPGQVEFQERSMGRLLCWRSKSGQGTPGRAVGTVWV